MKIDKAALAKKIKREEGVIRTAYQDHLGYWTIGAGRCIDKRKGGGLSDEEIEYLLSNDIESRYDHLMAAYPWMERMDPIRLEAVIEMSFQLGMAGFGEFKQTIAALRDERYEHAAVCALQSVWAKQTPDRARRVARQIETGQRQ